MKKDYRMYLTDILEAVNKIEEFVGEKNFSSFLKDEMCLNAVIRKLEIIGEASKNIPPKIRKQYG